VGSCSPVAAARSSLNWFPSFRTLGQRFNVVAMDHRGHGRGIRSRRRFRLSDCADDAAALIDELGTGPVIAVGYSMGGPVAQLLWRRHPEAVRGLVLCATSRSFANSNQERFMFAGLGGLALGARAVPRAVQRRLAQRVVGSRFDEAPMAAWAMSEMQRHSWHAILEAAQSLGRFDSRPWIGEVDVPAAVVAMRRDQLVSPQRQLALHRSIPDATLHVVDGDHTVCATAPGRFLGQLVPACESVARRSR
jgi:3-oxoadipate enol-lactonase